MKRNILLIVVLLCCSIYSMGQVPYGFSYQATVRNERGDLVTNRMVGVKLSIIKGSASGQVVYEERQEVRTNQHGVMSITIGEMGEMEVVDWTYGPYYLNVEIDPEGGYQYSIAVRQEFLSVPYAMNIGLTDSISGFDYKERQVIWMDGDTIYLTGGSYVSLSDYFDGDYNSLRNKPGLSSFVNDAGYMLQESQVLTLRGDTLFLTGESYVVLPKVFSGEYDSLINKPIIPQTIGDLVNDSNYLTEEVQVLSIGHDTIYLTGGSYVKLPSRMELQTIGDVAVLGNRAGNRQLKEVKDPTDVQDAVTLHYFDSILYEWLHPLVDYGTHNVEIVSVCDGYNWHGTRYTESGNYTYAYSNGDGHYSVDTLKLTVREGSHRMERKTVVDSYVWHGTRYETTGCYLYGYDNEEGCPSVDTLYLIIYTGDSALCESYREAVDTARIEGCGEVMWYGHKIRGTGVVEHNLGRVANGGCDSIVRVNVSILPVFQHDTAVRSETAITWRGNQYTKQGDYGDTLTAANGCDSIYTLHLMMGGALGIGAIHGEFSVANGLKVRFAQGNLQYQSSSNTWRLAEHQYEMADIECVTMYNSDWADLFGWATSGYHDEEDTLCVNYKPWSCEIVQAKRGTDGYVNNKYGYGPSMNRTEVNLVGENRNYDWGVYNRIVNGGNGADLWRTMSEREWKYLLYERENARHLRSMGSIRNVPLLSGDTAYSVDGYIILADEWECPRGVNFVPDSTCDQNSYSMAQWRQMEEAGAVFLPIREYGRYYGFKIGNYWTRTNYDAGGAYLFSMNRNSCVVASYHKGMQASVRLVQNVVGGSAVYECTSFDTVVVTTGSFSCNGHTYNESGEYVEVLRNSVGGDSIIYLTLIKVESGELNGLFSVGNGRQVKFSKGNLQYNASADVWRFADEQYGYLCDGNRHMSAKYRGWIDLYGWATSGYHDSTDVLNIRYEPWTMSSYSACGYGPSEHMSDRSMINTSAKYDWGVYNAIANGGNHAGQWRCMTNEEATYMFYERQNASELIGCGMVDGVHGLILLPDAWVAPTGIVFDAHNTERNRYTITQWEHMEGAGAVFLPACGYRSDDKIIAKNFEGKYWLATSNDVCFADCISFGTLGGAGCGSDWTGWGFNVRLVKDN